MIFRSKALTAYRDPVTKGGLLQMTPPWTVAMYLSLFAVVVIGAVILIFGKASIAVRGPGLVRPQGGAVILVAPRSAYVERLGVTEGADVPSNAELALLRDPALQAQLAHQREALSQLRSAASAAPVSSSPGSSEQWHERLASEQDQLEALRLQVEQLRMRTPVRGTVAHVHVRAGEFVSEGTPVVTLLPTERPLVGYVAMRERDRPRIRPGATMRLRLDAYPAQEVGFATGTIRSVGKDLLSEPWEKQFAAIQGAPVQPSILVEISLDSMPPQAQGHFENGMIFWGEVVVGEQRIASMLL